MNLKTFRLSVLFLLLMGNLIGQNTFERTGNTADITLSVIDVSNRQEFTLETDNVQYFNVGEGYAFRFTLNYESELHVTTFFRMQYHFAVENFDGTIDDSEPLRGTTAPVIIPPVRKTIVNEFRPAGSEYPYFVQNIVPLFPVNYRVYISLCRYNTWGDYLANVNGDCSQGPFLEYRLKSARTSSPTTGSSYEINTFPNPSVDQVTIAVKNTTEVKNKPLQVSIFNKNGLQINTQTIKSHHEKSNQVLYAVDIAHLPKGMYFFEIVHEKKKIVKTILKE